MKHKLSDIVFRLNVIKTGAKMNLFSILKDKTNLMWGTAKLHSKNREEWQQDLKTNKQKQKLAEALVEY